MGVIKNVCMAVVTLIFFNVTYAADSSYESVLTPGARLLEGNANQGDFYILGQNDTPQTVAALGIPVQQSKNGQAQAAIKTTSPLAKTAANNHPVISSSKANTAIKIKMMTAHSHVKSASKKIRHRLAGKKTLSKNHMARYEKQQHVFSQKLKSPTKITTRKIKHGIAINEKIAKIKTVLHHATHKMASHSKNSHVKMAAKKVTYHFAHKKNGSKIRTSLVKARKTSITG